MRGNSEGLSCIKGSKREVERVELTSFRDASVPSLDPLDEKQEQTRDEVHGLRGGNGSAKRARERKMQ